MAGFIERNKKKGLLALLLYLARRGKAVLGLMTALAAGALLFLFGTPEAVRQKIPWAPKGVLTRGFDASRSGLGAQEQDVAMRLSEEKGDGMEALVRRMLGGSTSGPKGPVVDMVAAKSAELQEESAEKQVGDKISKHGRRIRGILRKEDSSSPGSASLSLSQAELKRGLSSSPDALIQPQAARRGSRPSGGAPIAEGSGSAAGSGPSFSSVQSGSPLVGEEDSSEEGGQAQDTTELVAGGSGGPGEGRPDDPQAQLLDDTYGGGGGGAGGGDGGKIDGGKDLCAANKTSQGCLAWKAEKDKAEQRESNVKLWEGKCDRSSPDTTCARFQLATTKAYSFAAAPPTGRDGYDGVNVNTLVWDKSAKQWRSEPHQGQCDSNNCSKEYASTMATLPFENNDAKGGLVSVKGAEVALGDDVDYKKVDDYAQRIADMDAKAKRCEQLAKEGYGSTNNSNLWNEFMKASDKYLENIRDYRFGGRLLGDGGGKGHQYYTKYFPGNTGTGTDPGLLQECGLPPSAARAGKKDEHWTKKIGEWNTEVGRMEGRCRNKEGCRGHPVSCGTNCTRTEYYDCDHDSCQASIRIRNQRDEARDKRNATQNNYAFCQQQAGPLRIACKAVMEAVKHKREAAECQGEGGSEFNIWDAENKETVDAALGNVGKLDCERLVWHSNANDQIAFIVNGRDAQGNAVENMGRDKCFKVGGSEGKCD